jgi:hypothetical protein
VLLPLQLLTLLLLLPLRLLLLRPLKRLSNFGKIRQVIASQANLIRTKMDYFGLFNVSPIFDHI